MMTKYELLQQLKASISEEERVALNDMDSGLTIGKHNRTFMQQMLAMDDVGDKVIDDQKVSELKELLQSYLNQYMEQVEGHKWVILACLFNSFILEIPMHPFEVTKIQIVDTDDGKVYICPHKEVHDGSVCDFCVCESE